jgi:phosphoglycolate phosphatase-like HAD superfamily hydrolase
VTDRSAHNQLAIFDIDGTLTATNSVDDECYLRAVAEALGFDVNVVDWSDAPHVTDSAIARWLWTRHRDRPPDPRELADLQERFLALLNAALVSTPERFAPIEGAREIMDHLRSAGWCVAIATGGWGASARIKLHAAGLVTDNVPLACSDHAESREDIVRLAWQKAESETGARFQRMVSVGDAPWDVRTAHSLGIPFVGIATGDAAHRLRTTGATTVLPHFADRSAVLDAFNAASVPSLTQQGIPRNVERTHAGTVGRFHPG